MHNTAFLVIGISIKIRTIASIRLGNRVIDSVYQTYTLINTHEPWWLMVCANVYFTTKLEGVNLENDEIKRVLVILVASYFLQEVTCTR